MEPILLSAEDRAILELEGPTVAGHTCKLILLDDPAPPIGALRARVAARLERAPLLGRRLDLERPAPSWVVEPDVDIDRQVALAGEGQVEPTELAALVASLFEQRLPRDRPLWQIDLARLAGGGAALVWRLHHALADGTAAMRFARELLWDEEAAPGPASSSETASRPSRPAAGHAGHGKDDQRRRGHLAAFLEREFSESIERSPFDGEVGARRTVAFARVPFAPLHDAAKRIAGATVNDAVLSVVAGSLRRWVSHHHGHPGTIRMRVPVSLHSEGDGAANRDSFFTVPVRLDQADPLERLRAIGTETATRKSDADAERLDEMLRNLRERAAPLAGLAERLEASPRSFALCVSNVPGPRARVAVLGSPVRSLHTIAEVGRRHGLRVAVVSYAGQLGFGLCADPAIAGDLDAMAEGIEREAEELIGAAA